MCHDYYVADEIVADDVDDALASVRDVVTCTQQMSRLESLLAWDHVRNRATAAARDLCCAATTLQAVLSETYPQDGDVLEDAALLTHQLRSFHLPLQHESIKVAQALERVAILTAFGLLPMSQGSVHLDAALHLLFRYCYYCSCGTSSSPTTSTANNNYNYNNDYNNDSDKETTLEEVLLTNEVDLLLKRATEVRSQDPIYGLVLCSVAHLLDSSISRHTPRQHDSFKPDWPRARTDPRFLYLRALAITATHEQGVRLMQPSSDGTLFEDFTETYPTEFVEFWEQDESQYELQSDRLAIATTDALRVLCRDPLLRRKAAIAGCVAPLARFLHPKRSLTLRAAVAARALGNLVLAGEGCRREAEKYGVVNSLLAMLAGYTTIRRESTTNLMVRHAVEALANLAANSKTMQQEILRTKPDLFVSLTHILESEKVVRISADDDQTNLHLLIATSRLVRNLTSRCPSNRLAAKGSGMLKVIAAKIVILAKEREGNGSVTVDRWLLMALASLCEGCPTAAEEAADVPGLLDALFSYLIELTECTQMAAVIALSHVLTARRPFPAEWTMRTVAAALVGILKEVAVAASIDTVLGPSPEPVQYQRDKRIQTDGSESLGARAAATCIDVLADVSNDREAFGWAGAPQVLCDVIIALSGPSTRNSTCGESPTPTREWHPAILGAAIKALCTLLSGRYNANRNLVLASHNNGRSRRLARVLVGLLDPNKASESKGGGQHYKRDVVRVLSMLCSVGNEENGKIDGAAVFVDAVVAAGGIQALVRICNSQKEHFKEVAATALSNLACIPDLHPTMLAAECVPPLLSMLSPTSPTPHRRSAACCVANLVAEGTIPPAIRRELSQTVINLVSLSYTGVGNDSSSTAAAAAAGALGNLGCAGKSGIDAVLRKGGIEALTRLVGSPSPAVREAAVQGLWDCCRSDSSSRVAGVMARAATRSNSNSNSNGQNSAEDLVPAMVHALRVAGSLPTAVAATGCLATILALKRSDIREMALRAGARGALMSRTAESFREGFGDSSAEMSLSAQDSQSTLGLGEGLEDGELSAIDGEKENWEGELNRLVAKALRCLSSTNTVERNVERQDVEQVETQLQRQLQLQINLEEVETVEQENSIAAGVKKCFSFDQDSAVSCLVRATS